MRRSDRFWWVAFAAAIVSTSVYAASGVWTVNYNRPTLSVGVGAGALLVMWRNSAISLPGRWSVGSHTAGLSEIRFKRESLAGVQRRVIPLWPLAAASVLATIWAWRRRPFPPGRCSSCGYDLRGLESDHCPECGTARARAKEPPPTSSV
jgi:hypothetical protein